MTTLIAASPKPAPGVLAKAVTRLSDEASARALALHERASRIGLGPCALTRGEAQKARTAP